MSDTPLSNDQSATPKTDEQAFSLFSTVGNVTNVEFVVDREFARAQERRIAELEKALEPFSRPEVFEECDQISKLITQISRNPVNGADAWRWWLGRHLSVHHFKVARTALQNVSKP